MDNLKRYLVSSGVTFSTAFLISLAALLKSGAVTSENLGWSVLGSIFVVAVRAGVKAVFEGIVVPVAGATKRALSGIELSK